MNALINAHSNVGGEPTDSPLSDGLTSNAIPEAKRSQTGVSVNYAQLSDISVPLGRNAPFQYIDGKQYVTNNLWLIPVHSLQSLTTNKSTCGH